MTPERTNEDRLAAIRKSIEAENISWGELIELQGLTEHIDSGDVLLLEWAGVPEVEARCEVCDSRAVGVLGGTDYYCQVHESQVVDAHAFETTT